MTLRPEYSLGHSEFNEFLFAFVGEERSGQQLTLFSALARLGLDPWGEAARLSELPKEAATHELSAVIGKLPGGRWKASDRQSIAVRLVDCLPKRGSHGIARYNTQSSAILGAISVLWEISPQCGKTCFGADYTTRSRLG